MLTFGRKLEIVVSEADKNLAMPKDGQTGLDQPIYYFETKDGHRIPWTKRDSFEGVQIFGATGSGKTSGSGRALARSFLKHGYGGLVLTAKPEDAAWWRDLAEELAREQAGVDRTRDLIFFLRDGKAFNFLAYEHAHTQIKGHLTANLVALFLTVLGAGQDKVSHSDPYWEDALRQLLTHAIDLCSMANEAVTLPRIAEVVRSAPQTRFEAASPYWQSTATCAQLLQRAYEHLTDASGAPTDEQRFGDWEDTFSYWTSDFAGLADRTRSVVVSSFTAKAGLLMRSPMRTLFCGAETSVRPEDTHAGKILVMDLPVKDYGESGRFAQTIMKTAWQRATERRVITPKVSPCPVFLWADESQYFITNADMLFQQTARSKHAATVYLTQNLPNYYAMMGGRDGHVATDSLLGNLQTKLFHSNGDPTTNEWAERLFGKRRTQHVSSSQNAQAGNTVGYNEAVEALVLGSRFTKLLRGGPRNASRVEAVLFAVSATQSTDAARSPVAPTVVFSQTGGGPST